MRILVLNSLGFFFLEFILPFIASQELAATGTSMGLIFSVHVFGYIASSALAGAIADRVSKLRLIVIGSFGRGISYLVLYAAVIAQSLPFVTVGAFTLGFLVGTFWVPFDALLSQKSDKDHRSYAFGRKSRATGTGSLIGGVLGMGSFVLVSQVAPDVPALLYVALPVFGILNMVAAGLYRARVDEHLIFPEAGDETGFTREPASFPEPHQDPSTLTRPFLLALALILTTFFLASVNAGLSRPFIEVYMLENIQDDPFLAALAYAPSGIVPLLFAERLGKVLDRVDLRLGLALISVIGAGVTWILIHLTALWQFALVLVIDLTIVSASDLIIRNIFSRISKDHRGKILGVQGFFGNLGYAIGPILGGIVWDAWGPRWPFLISIGVELLLVPVFIGALTALRPHFAERRAVDEKTHAANKAEPETLDAGHALRDSRP